MLLSVISYRLNGYPIKDVVVIWANFTGASYAAFVNYTYSRGEPVRHVKRAQRLIAAYAAFYACAYAALLFGPWGRLDWSRFISPFSIPVWFIAWTAWARYRRQYKEQLRPKTSDEMRAIIAETDS